MGSNQSQPEPPMISTIEFGRLYTHAEICNLERLGVINYDPNRPYGKQYKFYQERYGADKWVVCRPYYD